ncbi:ATPase component, ABC-type branched-chain amino acid transporter [Aurantimonas manganoxydans SI85-9A1]|uniref:ATPase component, ABC-type branched-chain amino acid transporter n=1 Tax=Aurantimonas manganoxydans (strain ATCC BAA-1229 / DSM 21871 / SI85-9A1) TaxID=287752 RepID=Q1YJI6_AURMS|nr:ABC transporter ATP-binding protein [Aurantimonas manganoxydans]EAS50887.1 ATPase component, ABC-type branched-chain amino acid transporter [Aurantimonas manganoxydans SI85-9A1]
MIEAPGRPQGPALLEVRDLHGWYGESHVLHGVSLDLHEGETITLVGRNGAGKTTTLRAIMNLLPRREGLIRIAGADMMKVPVHRTAYSGIGYVPEERGIFATLTVSENLMLPPTVAPGGMSIEEIYDLFPNLAERRDSPGTKLSGGEQQMLAIARILRTGVKIILLDEPTEGLAPVIIQRIGDVLMELKKKGMTLLLVEQNFRFARKVADRFFLMEDGHILESFPTSELDARMDRLHEVVGV